MEAADRLADQAPDRSGIDRHTLVIHTDASVLDAPDDQPELPGGKAQEPRMLPVRASAEARMRAMPLKVLRRLACDARMAVVAHDTDGNVVSASGTTRSIPARLRRMLHARDRGCRFPSCNATRGLEGHHVVHWAEGGPTAMHNLLLLCRYHHTFVHEHKWRILHDGHGHVRLQPPTHDPLPTVHPPGPIDPLHRYTSESFDALEFEPDALRSGWEGTRPDISAAVGLLLDAIERAQPPDNGTHTAAA